MAITPRTVFSNPATAAMTVASVLAVSAIGVYAMSSCAKYSGCKMRAKQVAVKRIAQDSPCDHIRQSNGPDKSHWSEYGWFQYASCFADQNNSRHVVEVSSQALSYYPRSEAIFNLKGYHLVQLREYTEAVHTLRLGIERVGRPTSGTMANNLAWAGLWAPREMKLTEARSHYKAALAVEPGVCETIHTGMWVEYGVVKHGEGFERLEALRQFNRLSEQYTACHDRYKDGSFNSMVEVLGAAVLISEMTDGPSLDNVAPDVRLLNEVTSELRQRYKGTSIDYLCRESIPLATAHHTCTEILSSSVKNQQRAEQYRRLVR